MKAHLYSPDSLPSGTILGRSFSFAGLAGLWLLCSSVALASSATIAFGDGRVEIQELAVGSNLWLGASGLPSLTTVEVVLSDDLHQVVLKQERMTSTKGRLAKARLWSRTGIGGCDCAKLGDGYPFVWPYEAQVLVGSSFNITIYELATGLELASRPLAVVASHQPLLFPSGTSGCPMQQLDVDQPMFLGSDGPVSQPSRLFLVRHRPNWTLGDALLDVRAGYSQGQRLPAVADRLGELVATGHELPEGKYSLIWRAGGKPGNLLLKQDSVITLPYFELDDVPSDGGMVISDWGCGGGGQP